VNKRRNFPPIKEITLPKGRTKIANLILGEELGLPWKKSKPISFKNLNLIWGRI